MKKHKFEASIEQSVKQFKEQLAQGLWDDNMTDEEIDIFAEEMKQKSRALREKLKKENPKNVIVTERVSPYDDVKLRREDYNN